MLKKILTTLLSVSMLMSGIGLPILANEQEPETEEINEFFIEEMDDELAEELEEEIVSLEAGKIIEEGEIGTAQWTIDDKGTLTIGEGEFENIILYTAPWLEFGDQIKSIDGKSSFKLIGSFSRLFAGLTNLETVDLSGWDTSDVSFLTSFFSNCPALTTVNLSNWNTSNFKNISYFFNDCTSLTTVDLSSWDISNVTDLEKLFGNCKSLTTIKLGKWDTSNVTNMKYLFEGCESLKTLNLSEWNTSNVIDMYGLFRGCKSLAALNISTWNTSKVKKMAFLFSGCTSLTTLNLSNWDTSNVQVMHGIFHQCESLTTVDISNWDTSNVVIFKDSNDGQNISKIKYNHLCENLVRSIVYGSDYSEEWYIDGQGPYSSHYQLPSIPLGQISVLTRGQANIDNKLDIYSWTSIAGIEKFYTYTGEKIIPSLKIINLENELLKEGSDYTVKCTNNVEVGIATITIKGIGKYTGTITTTYEIRRPTTYSVKMAGGDTYPVISFNWDPNSIFKNTSTYNNDKAVGSLLLAHGIYYGEKELLRIGKDLDLFNNSSISKYYKSNKINLLDGKVYESPNHQFILTTDANNQKSLVVVIQGSKSWEDWVLDFMDGGFESASLDVYHDLKNFLLSHSVSLSEVKIFMTGHSLGGAVCDLLNHLLISRDNVSLNNIECYTFAAPKTVSKEVEKHLNAHILYNSSDLVPQMNPDIIRAYLGTPDIVDFTTTNPVELVFYLSHYGTEKCLSTLAKKDDLKKNYQALFGHPIYDHALGWQPYQTDFENFVGVVGAAHGCEVYMALLYENPVFTEEIPGRVVGIFCPVDVEVIDSNNKVVASVIRNEISNLDPEKISVITCNTHKMILLNKNSDYNLNLIASNTGKMSICVSDFNSNEEIENILFNNVELESEKHFNLSLNDLDDKKLFVTDNQGNKLNIVNNDGQETPLLSPSPNPVTPSEPVSPQPTRPSNNSSDPAPIIPKNEMYRLYNPNSGEHFYTADTAEKDHLVSVGWYYEGLGWNAPKTSKTPVYRLYNENAGDHHYTTDSNEKDTLVRIGWKDEGTGWYSDDNEGRALYRVYNPNAKAAGSHHYTLDSDEQAYLVSIGWNPEGIAWYGLKS